MDERTCVGEPGGVPPAQGHARERTNAVHPPAEPCPGVTHALPAAPAIPRKLALILRMEY